MPSSKPKTVLVNQEPLTVTDAAEWSEWLGREADTSNGVMLTVVKKGFSDPTTLTYEEARDEALCHGWIDSTGYKRDDSTYVRRFTPRRARSVWSKLNIDHVARLEREGRMLQRGWSEVEKAKADGRWDAAYQQANLTPPGDLVAAIAVVPEAQSQWDVLTKQNKFAVCFRLASLKTQAGRQKRLQAFVDMLARGETIHPQKQTREAVKPVEQGAARARRKGAKQVVAVPEESIPRSPRRRSTRLSKVP